MFKKRCTLCGGNLVYGKCTECGLDNNKKRMSHSDDVMEEYKPWKHSSEAFGDELRSDSRTSSSSKNMSNEEFFENIRREQREMECENVPPNRPPLKRPAQPIGSPTPPLRDRQSKEKPQSVKIVRGIIIFMIVMNLLSAVIGIVGNMFEEFTGVMFF